MNKEARTAVYDKVLQLEAYHFQGFTKPFPNHFHEYYVIGLVEAGQRSFSCATQKCVLGPGHVLLLNPGDSHACVQTDGALNYLSFNLSKEVMENLAEEILECRELPRFSPNIVLDVEAANCVRRLHKMVLSNSQEFDKEEHLLFLISLLIQRYSQPFAHRVSECRKEIDLVCALMEADFAEHMDLEQLCRYVGLSRSTLLRAFTKSKGVTPYSYLMNIRVGAAKKLLEQGVPPIEAALRTGFSDQSHFTNCFSRLIGLSPGVYREIFVKNEKRNKNGLEK